MQLSKSVLHSIVLVGFLCLSSTWLAACAEHSQKPVAELTKKIVGTKESPDDINNAEQAQRWLEKQAQHMKNATDNEVGKPLQASDYRWLRTAGKISDAVFITLNNEAPNEAKNKNADAVSPQSSLSPVDADMFNEGGVGSDPMVGSQVQPQESTGLGLAQAQAEQIKFLGILQHENEQFGLVQVGERVYRIQVNESIGVGKWRVVAITDVSMQLMVNGKVVIYGR